MEILGCSVSLMKEMWGSRQLNFSIGERGDSLRRTCGSDL